MVGVCLWKGHFTMEWLFGCFWWGHKYVRKDSSTSQVFTFGCELRFCGLARASSTG